MNNSQSPKGSPPTTFSTVMDAIAHGMALREKKRRSAWAGEDDRIHVSELKDCERRVIFTRIGMPITHVEDPANRLMMDVGTAYHHVIQEMLKDAGVHVRSDDADNPWIVSNDQIVGHPDCLIVLGEHAPVLDFKSIKEAGFDRLQLAKNDDVLQLNCYLGLLNMKKGRLVYVNRNNGKIKEFEVDYDHDLWIECWQQRAPMLKQAIEDAKTIGILPPVNIDFGAKSYPCYYATRDGIETYCRFHGHCWPRALREVPEGLRKDPKNPHFPLIKGTRTHAPARTREKDPEEGPGSEGVYAP